MIAKLSSPGVYLEYVELEWLFDDKNGGITYLLLFILERPLTKTEHSDEFRTNKLIKQNIMLCQIPFLQLLVQMLYWYDSLGIARYVLLEQLLVLFTTCANRRRRGVIQRYFTISIFETVSYATMDNQCETVMCVFHRKHLFLS